MNIKSNKHHACNASGTDHEGKNELVQLDHINRYMSQKFLLQDYWLPLADSKGEIVGRTRPPPLNTCLPLLLCFQVSRSAGINPFPMIGSKISARTPWLEIRKVALQHKIE